MQIYLFLYKFKLTCSVWENPLRFFASFCQISLNPPPILAILRKLKTLTYSFVVQLPKTWTSSCSFSRWRTATAVSTSRYRHLNLSLLRRNRLIDAANVSIQFDHKKHREIPPRNHSLSSYCLQLPFVTWFAPPPIWPALDVLLLIEEFESEFCCSTGDGWAGITWTRDKPTGTVERTKKQTKMRIMLI